MMILQLESPDGKHFIRFTNKISIQLIISLPFFPTTMFPTSGPFKDCYQVRQAGHTTSGMYLLKTEGSDRLIQAWCEHGLDNGGWTVLQRRRDGSVNFFRNWENYKVSSGNSSIGFEIVIAGFNKLNKK